jgi:hypothetical protein
MDSGDRTEECMCCKLYNGVPVRAFSIHIFYNMLDEDLDGIWLSTIVGSNRHSQKNSLLHCPFLTLP